MKSLSPEISTIQAEYVLVQAFKKAVTYIRNHNWFADVLELDLATVDYPSFLLQIQRKIRLPDRWKSQGVRLVPAPKSAPWWINRSGEWEPRPNHRGEATPASLRPLAHVPLRDQVVATALMLSLADRVETLQGDPRLDVRDPANRRRVLSYGNRLFCDTGKGRRSQRLRHRWGSTKLYRSYFLDYRTFISRPEIVAAQIGERSNKKTVIVHSDLSKFYDRVRPQLLHAKIEKRLDIKDPAFLRFVRRVLNWKWDDRDIAAAKGMTDVPSFDTLALPQGLVASGFFANVVLLDFDDAMRNAFDTEISHGILMRDAARYVDDLRFVVEVPDDYELKDVETACHRWIQTTLTETAPGLTANGDKTRAVAVHDPQRVMVFQSHRMRRIQETLSGGFDAHGGTQLLAALEGLFNTIGQFVTTDENGARWPLKAVPDVRDETVARFVAGRYRSTFRSLRPLLEDEFFPSAGPPSNDDEESLDAWTTVLTKGELDRQSQAFGLRLIEEWIRNPGNVRLLRVGLDLFPHSSVLESVLDLLKPIIISRRDSLGVKSVAEYCLAELFRAAATETGLVPDREVLPDNIDIEQYRDVLRDCARHLITDHWNALPWFLQQQILLFLAASSPVGIDVQKAHEATETAAYASMLAFLQGQSEDNLERWTANAVLARQSYLDAESAARLIVPQLTKKRIAALAELSPSVAEELILANDRLRRLVDRSILDRLSLPLRQPSANATELTLPMVSESRSWDCRLRNELSLVRFALQWLDHRAEAERGASPSMIEVSFREKDHHRVSFGEPVTNTLFEAPTSCARNEQWRFELGFVLRFIITGRSDPSETLLHPSWREHEHCYRPPSWHWVVRRYSLFNGRDRLGPEWLPVSTWMESFLTALLHWPRTLAPPQPFDNLRSISKAKSLCAARVRELESTRGEATGLLLLNITPVQGRLGKEKRRNRFGSVSLSWRFRSFETVGRPKHSARTIRSSMRLRRVTRTGDT